MIGSTDMPTGLATTSEDNFFGKVAMLEPTADPIRFDEVIVGLAGVWARENTREALWDAMMRKEVFATTGTRLRVRVFGGFDYQESDLDRYRGL